MCSAHTAHTLLRACLSLKIHYLYHLANFNYPTYLQHFFLYLQAKQPHCLHTIFQGNSKKSEIKAKLERTWRCSLLLLFCAENCCCSFFSIPCVCERKCVCVLCVCYCVCRALCMKSDAFDKRHVPHAKNYATQFSIAWLS